MTWTSRMKRRLRGGVARACEALPAPRDQAAKTMLLSARDLVTGAPTPRSTAVAPASGGPGWALVRPGPPLRKVRPLPKDFAWSPTPDVGPSGGVVKELYPAAAPVRFDVKLLDELNEEYRDQPIVKAPISYEASSLQTAAQKRVTWAHNDVDLLDQTVLEIGCGNGFEVWTLAHDFGCDAHGVDIHELRPWAGLRGDRVHLTCVDMSVDHPYPPNTFDRIISFTVWEHVAHPFALLREAYEVLKPGGLAWIRANLYAGPQASHLYRDIYFPWPHLLFSDDVIRDWNEMHGRPARGAAWVNRLSWAHYERYILEIGFRLRRLTFQEAEWDEPFYRRFEDVLGRFPRSDLRRDYFLAVLEKPAA